MTRKGKKYCVKDTEEKLQQREIRSTVAFNEGKVTNTWLDP